MIKLKNLARHQMNLDSAVLELLDKFHCLILAGGAIRDSLKGREIVDYDLFFTNTAFISRVKEHLVSKGAKLTFACPQGLLFSYTLGDVKVQLICKRQYASIKDLLDSFDFSICCYALDHQGVVYATKHAIRDNRKMVLRLVNLEYPTATINRLYKYRQKGFFVGNAIKDIVGRLVEMTPSMYSSEDDALYID